MTIMTNLENILADGTITKASFTVPSIISLTIARFNLDTPFTIISCDVQSRDEKLLSEAVAAIRSTMLEHDIDIMIPVADTKQKKNEE